MTRRWQPTRWARDAALYRRAGLNDLADRIETQLRQAGRCRLCGRPLTDPVSLERGVGPDCWTKQP